MEYKVKATAIGERSKRILEEGRVGLKVCNVLPSTIYLRSREEMVIVARRGTRSPYTINVSREDAERPFQSIVQIGDPAKMEDSTLRVGKLEIECDAAECYRPGRIPRIKSLGDPHERMIRRGLSSLMILYSMPSAGRPIYEFSGFRRFLEEVIYPLSRGEVRALRDGRSYRTLLGLGSGFTPAGDDFILGFASLVNLLDRALGVPKIVLEDRILFESTSWISAMFLKYAQRGFLDEPLHVMLKSISEADELGFMNSLLSLARKGHTSGLDTSLGVVTGLASVMDFIKGGNLTQNLLRRALTSSFDKGSL